MLVILLAVSYFAHIVISFKLLFSEYKCLDHSGIYTRKNGGAHSKHTKHFSKFKRHKDTTRVIAYTKMFGFFMFYRHSGLFFCREGQIQKQKVERIIAFRANLSKLW